MIFGHVLLLICLCGCSTINGLSKLPEERVPLDIYQDPPRQAGVQAPAQPRLPQQATAGTEGSLWQHHNAMASLFVDYKARSVGDIVTVVIVEDAKASNDARTNTGKQSDIAAQVKKPTHIAGKTVHRRRNLETVIVSLYDHRYDWPSRFIGIVTVA